MCLSKVSACVAGNVYFCTCSLNSFPGGGDELRGVTPSGLWCWRLPPVSVAVRRPCWGHPRQLLCWFTYPLHPKNMPIVSYHEWPDNSAMGQVLSGAALVWGTSASPLGSWGGGRWVGIEEVSWSSLVTCLCMLRRFSHV